MAQNPDSDRSSEDAYQLSRLRVLNRAIETAILQAKKDASHKSQDKPLPPAALRPLLNFVRLPTVAARKVLTVLDTEEQFRNSVAESFSEQDLGRGSWLFLHRPDGWSDELELLIVSAAEEEADAAAGVQGRTAERRLAQLEEALADLKVELVAAVETSQSATQALAVERAAALGAQATCDELSQRVQQLEQERQQAVRSMKEAEKRATARLEESRQATSRAEEFEQQLSQYLAEQTSPKIVVAAEAEAKVEEPDQTASSVAQTAYSAAQTASSMAQTRSPAETVAEQSLSEPPWQNIDPIAIHEAVRQAAEAARALGQQLAVVAQFIAPAVSLPRPNEDNPLESENPLESGNSLSVSEPHLAEASERAKRPPRRTPLRLVRGVIEGTPEGVEQLLLTPQIIVIADGYNISMEAWPQLDGSSQRDSLINLFATLQARTSAVIHVVFDGEGNGNRPAVSAPLAVRVHFSPTEVEADDLILQMVAELPTNQAVLVVSSDRRVQDGARRLGANVVSSAQLLSLTRSS
ncbi:MAG: NYN domain-containing protein [Microthrixaceae bacterium]